MNRLLGGADIVVGVLFQFVGVVALSGAETAADRFSREPEDMLAVLLIFFVAVSVGAGFQAVGMVLWRGRSVWRVSIRSAVSLSAGLCVILVLLSLVGFWPNDPTSTELRLLLGPAVLVGASFFSLSRRHLTRR
jgi:hypothetical protein